MERIRISEAIAEYNKKHKRQLNIGTLADIIVQDRTGRNGKPLSMEQKRWKFSRYNNGKAACPAHYVTAISKLCGVSGDYLLGLSSKIS